MLLALITHRLFSLERLHFHAAPQDAITPLQEDGETQLRRSYAQAVGDSEDSSNYLRSTAVSAATEFSCSGNCIGAPVSESALRRGERSAKGVNTAGRPNEAAIKELKKIMRRAKSSPEMPHPLSASGCDKASLAGASSALSAAPADGGERAGAPSRMRPASR